MRKDGNPAMEGMADIVIELDPATAPNTVKNFIHLASRGYYDGLCFHRVIPGFMIQGGCPDGNGTGGPGYSIKGEFSGNGVDNPLKHDRGVISMARAQHPDSAGSQFFIMVEASPHLDGQYAAFGQVVSGMETADAIVKGPRNRSDRPDTEMIMDSVTVDTFGEQYDEPEKLGER
ncbi:MAG: peptidylprolyl isomerase [Clostridiales bacterium]|nr:peptidylprolyl isomerase [Clostridiales bacterium]